MFSLSALRAEKMQWLHLCPLGQCNNNVAVAEHQRIVMPVRAAAAADAKEP
jgi:hypothetical protein